MFNTNELLIDKNESLVTQQNHYKEQGSLTSRLGSTGTDIWLSVSSQPFFPTRQILPPQYTEIPNGRQVQPIAALFLLLRFEPKVPTLDPNLPMILRVQRNIK